MFRMPSWAALTRGGLPQFEVTRRALTWDGQIHAEGAPLPADLVADGVRLRQLYEQRKIRVREQAPQKDVKNGIQQKQTTRARA